MKNSIGTVTKQANGLYLDAHKRNLLFDYKSKTIYVVSRESERKYLLFRTRFVLSLMIVIIMIGYTNWYIGLAIGILSLLLMDFAYRYSFLTSLEQLEDVEIPKRKTQYDIIKSEGKKSVAKRIIAFTLLAIIITCNCIHYVFVKNRDLGLLCQENLLMIVLSIIFLSISLYMDFVAIKVMINKEYKTK